MKVCIDINWRSFGIQRVIDSLKQYAPTEITLVPEADADLIIMHVVGRHNHRITQAEKLLECGKQYAVIQYALQSTRNPDPQEWTTLWEKAKVVWSYYDLRKYIPSQYLAPLATNTEMFYPEKVDKKYLVCTLGNCYKAECIGEVRLSAFLIGRTAHIGPTEELSPITDFYQNITDDELRHVYNQSKFISALRRNDGFEIAAIESLLCGVRPIMFDAPRFRMWFDGLAEFIPEDSSNKVINSLQALFNCEPRPVTAHEIKETKSRFNWERIAKGFWEQCMI